MRCTTLWEWDHPSFSQTLRLNFSFCTPYGNWCYTSRRSAMTFAARCTASVQIMVHLFESVSRHQRLGCSLQQCSAVCFQLQQQVFFFFLSPPVWLGPQVAPRDPTLCGGEWGELHTSHVNLDSVHSKVMCSSFKYIRACVYYMKGFSLICLYPLLLLRQLFAQIAESAKFM